MVTVKKTDVSGNKGAKAMPTNNAATNVRNEPSVVDAASNSTQSKNAGGRPLLFKTPEELQKRINAYFRHCDPHVTTVRALEYPKQENSRGKMVPDYDAEPVVVRKKVISDQIPYTVTGLALYLKTSRETLLNYEARDEFFDTIKEAKLKCENFAEIQLYSGKNVAGSIFNLKNNFSWLDTKQVDGTMNIQRSPYEDLSEDELRDKLDAAMKNLMQQDGTHGE